MKTRRRGRPRIEVNPTEEEIERMKLEIRKGWTKSPASEGKIKSTNHEQFARVGENAALT